MTLIRNKLNKESYLRKKLISRSKMVYINKTKKNQFLHTDVELPGTYMTAINKLQKLYTIELSFLLLLICLLSPIYINLYLLPIILQLIVYILIKTPLFLATS